MLSPRQLLGMALLGLILGLTSTPAGADPRAAARVESIEALVSSARFREAVERAPGLRKAVLGMAPSPRSRQLLVRTELAAGTAMLALGQESNATLCFLRALRIDPTLALDGSTPPKVRRSFDALREDGE
jgi:hypothetical protein